MAVAVTVSVTVTVAVTETGHRSRPPENPDNRVATVHQTSGASARPMWLDRTSTCSTSGLRRSMHAGQLTAASLRVKIAVRRHLPRDHPAKAPADERDRAARLRGDGLDLRQHQVAVALRIAGVRAEPPRPRVMPQPA
jgi:hypothetical protein